MGMAFQREVASGTVEADSGEAAARSAGKQTRGTGAAAGGGTGGVAVNALLGDVDADVGTPVHEARDHDDPFALHLEMKQTPGVAGAAPAGPAGPAAAAGDIGEPITETDGHDAIAGGITFTGAFSRGGTVDAGDFGTTSTTYPALTNVTITHTGTTFTVAADFALAVTWQVVTGDGPGGQKHLANATDPLITAANYTTAASDLTPNMSDLGGRPPRTQFFARDLTEQHEQFHARERVRFGRDAVTDATTWLATQTATDEAGVRAHLATARTRMIAYVRARMVNPGKEERAYADGAPAYLARATAIRTRGAAGGYP